MAVTTGKSQVLQARVPLELVRDVQRSAQRHGLTTSDIMRQGLVAEIARLEKAAKAAPAA